MNNPDGSQKDRYIEQIRRITKYEEMMRKAEHLINTENLHEDSQTALSGIMRELQAYYDSTDWKKDYADDEAGLLPPELKRGVLSEDGLYNLLEEYHKLHWYDGYMIRFRISGSTAILSANREGLRSLANHLINLSNLEAGSHIHLDQYNALEDGSDEIIIEKVISKSE